MVDALRWCPDCEVLGRGSDRCWNCGRPFDPEDEPVERMRDLVETDPPPEPDRDIRS
ncbi:MAG: hypothetical protein ACRDKW_13445 [Actinomycetota bacterium]